MPDAPKRPDDQLTDTQWDRVNAALDGDLDPAQLDPAERAQHDQLAAAESEIAGALAGATAPPLPQPNTAGRIAPTKNPRRLAPIFAAAAALLLAATAGIYATARLAWQNYGTPVATTNTTEADRLWSLATKFRNLEPEVVCDTPEKFEQYTQQAFGVTIAADFNPATNGGITLIGWIYPDDGYGADTDPADITGRRILMARDNAGDPVIAVFDDADLRLDEPSSQLIATNTTLAGIRVQELHGLASPGPMLLPILSAR